MNKSAAQPVRDLWESVGLPAEPLQIVEITPDDPRDGVEWELYVNGQENPVGIIYEADEQALYDAQRLVVIMARLPNIIPNLLNLFTSLEEDYRRTRRALFLARILLETEQRVGVRTQAWRAVLGVR